MPTIQFLIDRRESGQTVAEVLHKRFQLSWSRAKRLVVNGHVRVAGQLTRVPEQRVKSGNRFWIDDGVIEQPKAAGAAGKAAKAPKPPAKAKPTAKAAKPPGTSPAAKIPVNTHAIDIVYSDDDVAVVNKPAGLTTVRNADEAAEFGPRGRKFLPKTLADLLPALLGRPNRKVDAVHRLDHDTTGLVVFARTREAARKLTLQFRRHTVDRRYLALTRGVPSGGRIESVLVRDRGDGRRGSGEAGTPDSKRAVTNVAVLEPLGGAALVECRLQTGRTHQVRIHLGEAGHPLCGETVYDRPVGGPPVPDPSGAKRPMLHAARLGFDHPETDERMTWDVDPPADFAAVLRTLRDAAPPGGPTEE